jgi:hypothetical protein
LSSALLNPVIIVKISSQYQKSFCGEGKTDKPAGLQEPKLIQLEGGKEDNRWQLSIAERQDA